MWCIETPTGVLLKYTCATTAGLAWDIMWDQARNAPYDGWSAIQRRLGYRAVRVDVVKREVK